AAAAVTAAAHPDAANKFVDYLTGPAGRSLYARHGFGPPSAPG
ncbi:MAG: substrate-binding domain-containing protein, partial [Acidimicrobiales bacterium]